MQKFKNLAVLIASSLLLFSCGEYQKVLNKGTTSDQFKMAVKMYEGQKFDKALRLFEKVTPAYRGKPQMERISFMVAQSNFNEKNYTESGYYFDRFGKNYPKSSKKEEAAFLSAYSYKLASPRFSLDPTDTNKALESFQSFINTYPDSDKVEEANKHYKELRTKLEEKQFEIAKTYYRTADYDVRNYKAAMQAFDNLLEDYLGTKFKEEALFLKFKAAHDYELKSTDRRKQERIKIALEAYDKFKYSFPESKFLDEANEMEATLQKEKVRIDALVEKMKKATKNTKEIIK
ncbi:outer membrane protein assembly factor BamD [uncultured Polaribacter sp.]|uniref:outer membrane protein assembly factor BamD n=1 Tax=uncultured Polaribacter sp. TaxID=174711 RepID=UPI00260DF14D|nr:outer membrane protein assembly factor BamD [uncultured Polaribacter sp.]